MTTRQKRSLDAWIAKHVMGWKRVDGEAFQWGQFTVDSNRIVHADPVYGQFCPTSDRADAMMVLEKVHEKVHRGVTTAKTPDGKYLAYTKTSYGLHQADTLPLAICLLAKEVFE